MKVLYVTGANLTKNTSANMSHNGYVQGLIENGCDVDIIMAADSWGTSDQALPMWKQAKYYIYNSISFADRLKSRLKKTEKISVAPSAAQSVSDSAVKNKQSLRSYAKKAFYTIFPQDPLYPLHKTWLNSAKKFQSDKEYDIVISNSSPSASHTLVMELIEKKHIHFKRWVQIWEDPWYYDIYGGLSEAVRDEEHRLLRAASEIYYVSPLTLMYQKQYFSDCAEKMKYIPLPAFEYEDSDVIHDGEVKFGYFGDYYSRTRNLQPFYDAMISCNASGYIYGDTDLALESTEKVTVHGRTTLDKLAGIQGQTDVLIHLCNLRGGQIPGKIYHYSMTDKPIVFILDGTPDEQTELKRIFENYKRYIFCENTVASIAEVLRVLSDRVYLKKYKPVDAFKPEVIAEQLLADRL